jgi:hypothetical protein
MKWINSIYSKILQSSASSKKQKDFGYLLLVVTGVLYAHSIFKNGFNLNDTYYFLATFLVILIITFVYRKIFTPLLFLWLLIGEIMGGITSVLIMGVIYFLIFSPIVLILKLFRKEKIYQPEWKTVSRTIDYSKLS